MHEFGEAFVDMSVYAGRQNNCLRWDHVFKILFAEGRKEWLVLNKTWDMGVIRAEARCLGL